MEKLAAEAKGKHVGKLAIILCVENYVWKMVYTPRKSSPKKKMPEDLGDTEWARKVLYGTLVYLIFSICG